VREAGQGVPGRAVGNSNLPWVGEGGNHILYPDVDEVSGMVSHLRAVHQLTEDITHPGRPVNNGR